MKLYSHLHSRDVHSRVVHSRVVHSRDVHSRVVHSAAYQCVSGALEGAEGRGEGQGARHQKETGEGCTKCQTWTQHIWTFLQIIPSNIPSPTYFPCLFPFEHTSHVCSPRTYFPCFFPLKHTSPVCSPLNILTLFVPLEHTSSLCSPLKHTSSVCSPSNILPFFVPP